MLGVYSGLGNGIRGHLSAAANDANYGFGLYGAVWG